MNQSRKYESDGIEKETLVQHEFTWHSWSEELNVRAQGDAHEAHNQEHGRKYIEKGKVFQKCVSSHLLFSLKYVVSNERANPPGPKKTVL